MAPRALAKVEAHGFLVPDKPAGSTSARFLEPFQRIFVRAGHAGTLDPFATGALLVLVGDATRLARHATALPKRYLAAVRFGRETDTLDPEGRTVAEADPGEAAPEGLPAALRAMVGERLQEPPAFSARRVKGERAYAVARRGGEVRLEPRPVTVHRAEMREGSWPVVTIEIDCSSGTYVRAIARDLGRALGLPAHLAALRRLAIGPFGPEAMEPFEAPARVRPMEELLSAAGAAAVEVDAEKARRFLEGRPAEAPAPPGLAQVRHAGLLLGVARAGEGGILLPEIVFASAQKRMR